MVACDKANDAFNSDLEGKFETTVLPDGYVLNDQMSMTFQEIGIHFEMQFSSGYITVDWGNGKPLQTAKIENLIVDKDNGVSRMSYNYLYSDGEMKQIAPNYWGYYIDYDAVYTVTINCEDIQLFMTPPHQELISLDVSKNQTLKSLWSAHNRLKSLDVSQNTKLHTLMGYGNVLPALDVSGCRELEILSLFSNQLTSLDVSANAKLSYLDCRHNKFSADALNSLFATLHDNDLANSRAYPAKRILIYGNPGADTCDTSIAESKGWIVDFEYLPYFDVDAWFEQKYRDIKEGREEWLKKIGAF
jgi:hypothetical protein